MKPKKLQEPAFDLSCMTYTGGIALYNKLSFADRCLFGICASELKDKIRGDNLFRLLTFAERSRVQDMRVKLGVRFQQREPYVPLQFWQEALVKKFYLRELRFAYYFVHNILCAYNDSASLTCTLYADGSIKEVEMCMYDGILGQWYDGVIISEYLEVLKEDIPEVKPLIRKHKISLIV